ncbi:MAG: hypothetical protein ACREHV_09155 [Rhizomicrobium sp.]
MLKKRGEQAFRSQDGQFVASEHQLVRSPAALNRAVPATLDRHVRLREVNYPAWNIPNYTDGGDRLFILRHPALGWTSWRFAQSEANKIAEWLTKEIENRPNRAVPTGNGKN